MRRYQLACQSAACFGCADGAPKLGRLAARQSKSWIATRVLQELRSDPGGARAVIGTDAGHGRAAIGRRLGDARDEGGDDAGLAEELTFVIEVAHLGHRHRAAHRADDLGLPPATRLDDAFERIHAEHQPLGLLDAVVMQREAEHLLRRAAGEATELRDGDAAVALGREEPLQPLADLLVIARRIRTPRTLPQRALEHLLDRGLDVVGIDDDPRRGYPFLHLRRLAVGRSSRSTRSARSRHLRRRPRVYVASAHR
jgi:hypothetical protein